jgi:membrane-associated phospholipid phosphatase
MYNYRIILPLLLSLAVFSNSGFAGSEIKDELSDGLRYSFNSPRYLFAVGAIFGLSQFDKDVQSFSRHHPLPKSLDRFGDYYGKGLNYILASGVIWLDRGKSRHELTKRWRQMSEAYALNTLAMLVIKKTSHRARPDHSDHQSFPSGHTSTSFCTAAFLYGRQDRLTGLTGYALAGLTGYQRLQSNRHWFSDVLAGGLLGQLLGRGFSKLKESALSSSVSQNGMSLSWSVSW